MINNIHESGLPRHRISFKHAWDGLCHTYRTQPNLRIHLSVMMVVVVGGWWLEINRLEWLVVIFTCLWVIISEMINTSIEAVVDLVTETKHREAKIAKDVAAGVVLVGAIGSVVVGVIIFLPKIMALLISGR